MATAPLIDVKDLSVEFGEGTQASRVVKNVSFNIADGETVALVGELGSGKTVSALSILRLLPQSASHPTGTILFEGKDILKIPRKTCAPFAATAYRSSFKSR